MAHESFDPPGRVITYFGAMPTTANPTTTVTTQPGVICPELTSSFVKKRSDSILRCTWGSNASVTVSSKIHTTLMVNSSEYANPRFRTGFEASGANDQGTQSARIDVTGLAAGTHLLEVFFRTTAGTATLVGVDRSFHIEEIVLPT